MRSHQVILHMFNIKKYAMVILHQKQAPSCDKISGGTNKIRKLSVLGSIICIKSLLNVVFRGHMKHVMLPEQSVICTLFYSQGYYQS